ncbi:MAG: YciI family protein [Alphaproteobacteria bacterium]|nr:YciI family protein [Alphaproteobacteria bacterium]
MIYVITCVDKPGHGAVRKENRTAHLAYLRDAGDTLFAAGPTLTDDASSVTGSVILVDLPDKQAAETFAADDPYAKAGVFESVTIKAWKKVFPED